MFRREEEGQLGVWLLNILRAKLIFFFPRPNNSKVEMDTFP